MKFRSSTAVACAVGAVVAGAWTTTVVALSASAQPTVQHQQKLPPGMHWRYMKYQVADCGGHQIPGHWAIVVWRGTGDMQSAIFCPGQPWGNGFVWPS